MRLDDSVDAIKGIGAKTREYFEKLGVTSVGSLLSFYPRRYDSFEEPQDIRSLKAGDTGVICSSVTNVIEPKIRSKIKIITCKASDPTGEIDMIWFNQPYVKYELKPGYHYIFRGKVTGTPGKLSMEQAKIFKREDYYKLQNSLQPVYSLTKGLTNNAVTKAMKQALTLSGELPEYIPAGIRKQFGLIKKNHALTEMHFPKSTDTLKEARKSLVFEEFFLFGCFLKAMSQGKSRDDGTVLNNTELCDKLIKSLPYSLTEDQENAFNEIKKDLSSGQVMARLIQGDVGSGKTVIAELAMLMAAADHHQAAIMVPTEVLAAQHYKSMKETFDSFGINTVLLTGSLSASEKKKIREDIKEHRADIIVGTHTLLQDKTEFADLVLCVTDEQHRFGVNQRKNFGQKNEKAHILVMSATPIPRTLALIMYGDMDISLIKQLPGGRKKIKNCVVGPEYRPTAYKFIRDEIEKGRQAYVICPMISSDDGEMGENVEDYSEALSETMGNSITVEKLHGKMSPEEKNEVMKRFSENIANILVSTTVVEVGVNVPNATVMMIENAERFGLAQLHQLRGRVGRGDYQSYCIFMYGKASEESKERLNILRDSNDGFEIAAKDLELRGPGDLFGIRQCGDMYFKLGDIYNDANTLKDAYEAVSTLSDEEILNIISKMFESSAKEVFKFLENYVTI